MPIPKKKRVYEPSQEEITFYLGAYRDHEKAKWCLKNIRKLYNKSRIFLISDGHDTDDYRKMSDSLNVEYIPGERLYTVQNGGLIVHRMLEHFQKDPSRWLFKLDTDTCVHRKFRYLPSGKLVFGTLRYETQGRGVPLDPPSVQGGCIGFTQKAASSMYESEIFKSPRLIDYEKTYAKNVKDIIARAESGLVSFDFLVRYGYMELDIPIRDFEEVKSVWRGSIENSDLRYAVTHPHKELSVLGKFKKVLRTVKSYLS